MCCNPLQENHWIKGLDPVADAFSGTVYSDIVNMKNWEWVTFIVYAGVGTTGTSTLTVEPCANTSGTPGTAVAFHYREVTSGDTPGTLTACANTGFTMTAGSSRLALVTVSAAALAASGYNYVRLKAVQSVDAEVLGCILVMLSGPRYATEPNVTAIT